MTKETLAEALSQGLGQACYTVSRPKSSCSAPLNHSALASVVVPRPNVISGLFGPIWGLVHDLQPHLHCLILLGQSFWPEGKFQTTLCKGAESESKEPLPEKHVCLPTSGHLSAQLAGHCDLFCSGGRRDLWYATLKQLQLQCDTC